MAGDNTKTLVRMANQIATFFKPYGDEEGIAGVQNHLRKFWSPTMRRDLAAHIEHGGEGLEPVVIEAFKTIANAPNPVHRAAAGPGELGQMTSDAG